MLKKIIPILTALLIAATGFSQTAGIKTSASSILENKARYSHKNLIDGNIFTAWAEGARGFGKGQWVKLDFGATKHLYYLGIIPGYSKYNDVVGEVWFKNFRVKKAQLEFSDGSKKIVDFVDKHQMQYFAIDKETSFVKLTLLDVYPTLKWEDTCISEILPVFENVSDMQVSLDYNLKSINNKTKDFYALLKIQAPYTENDKKDPINVSLVIDRSGSMDEEDKMKYAKEAAKLIVGALGESDTLSIVGYDDEIETILPPTKVLNQNKNKIIQSIESLSPRNSTNIMGGIERAVELIKSANTDDNTSRVILLLSDGLANQGVTDANEMKNRASEIKNQHNISISTFGLGVDYSEDNLSSLAEASLGKYYFVKNPRQIFMFFHKELTNILNMIATDVTIQIDSINNAKISKIYGYQAKQNNALFEMPAISQGEQKLILLQGQKHSNQPITISGKITFLNKLTDSKETKIFSTTLSPSASSNVDLNNAIQSEVLRILAAANLSETIVQYAQGDSSKAMTRLQNHIQKLERDNRYLKSEVLAQEIEILKSILKDMQTHSSSSSSGNILIKFSKEHALKVLKSEN